jgi:hypothetical protein
MCKNEHFKYGILELLHNIRWAHTYTHTQIEVVTTFAAYPSLQNMISLRKMNSSSAKVFDAIYKHVFR